MSLTETITVQLITTNKAIYEASISIQSKYHLLVEKINLSCDDEMIFKQTVLDVKRMKFNLGASRISRIEGTETYELYFLNNIYNLETLVSDMKYIDIIPHFQNLKLILTKQSDIRPEFKEYVLKLNYKLNCYKQLFDQFEQELSHENSAACARLQMAVIKSIEGIRFIEYFDNRRTKCYEAWD